jgi:hypothetical protein
MLINGLFSINVVSFSRNVVLRGLSFSINLVPKRGYYRSGPFMFSVRYTYALSPRPRNARFRLSLFHFDADYGARRPFEFRTKRQSIAVHPPVSPRPLLRYLRRHKILSGFIRMRPYPEMHRHHHARKAGAGDCYKESSGSFRPVPCPIADGESAPTARTQFCPRADR